MNRGVGAYALVVASMCAACSRSSTTPTPVPQGPAQLTRLSVTGNASLTAIGDTSQLKATATFSDGMVKDVTTETRWTSGNPSVMTVSPTGLVSVLRLGATTISAFYPNQSATLSVTATPAGTFAMTGFVKEPGEGGVANLRVTDTASAMSTLTEFGGRFFLALHSGTSAHLKFEKDDYEPIELDAVPGVILDVRVQQMIRLIAGETVAPDRLAPFDLTYDVGAGQRCNSCRLVRIVVPTKGMLHLRLTWPAACPVTLGLWLGGRHIVPAAASSTEVETDVAATAGEMILYVDRVSPAATACHVPFVLTTSLTE